jgi:AraC family transcriptional regulator
MSPAPSRTSVLASSVAGGIELRELVYGVHAIPRHAHPLAGFCVVFDGEYEERYASRTLACGARTVTFSPAGEAHSNVFVAARSHCVTVDVPEPWLERLESSRPRLREPFAMRGGPLAWLGARLRGEMGADDDSSRLIVEGLVMEMLGEAARGSAAPEERQISAAIRNAHELLHEQFRGPVSLASIAAATGRNPVYIASAFRQAYGETIGDCLRRLRVEEASRALAASAAPLAEVALAAGFANQSHFTRVFRRATGMTPAVYRAAHLNRGPRP